MLRRICFAGLIIIGFGACHYVTWYSPVADSNLILFGFIHIHHWLWSLLGIFLLLTDRLFSFAALLCFLGVGHFMQNHFGPAIGFLIATPLIYFRMILLGLLIGTMAEGIFFGFYEGLMYNSWVTFQVILK